MSARRWLVLGLALLLTLALVSCGSKPVQQGMATKDGLTFLASTVTNEKAGTVAVTVIMTNGTGDALYLCAPEQAGAEGALAVLSRHDTEWRRERVRRAAETGLIRWMSVDARESYSETWVFTGTLPGDLDRDGADGGELQRGVHRNSGRVGTEVKPLGKTARRISPRPSSPKIPSRSQTIQEMGAGGDFQLGAFRRSVAAFTAAAAFAVGENAMIVGDAMADVVILDGQFDGLLGQN